MGLVEVLRVLSHVALMAVLEEPGTYSMTHLLQPRGSGANDLDEFWASQLQMLKGSWLLRGHKKFSRGREPLDTPTRSKTANWSHSLF